MCLLDWAQRVLAAHPRVADQRIHDGVLEGVAHVQGAGHVRRRNHDAVRRTIARGVLAGGEAAVSLPSLAPTGFYSGGFKRLFHEDRSLGANLQARAT